MGKSLHSAKKIRVDRAPTMFLNLSDVGVGWTNHHSPIAVEFGDRYFCETERQLRFACRRLPVSAGESREACLEKIRKKKQLPLYRKWWL